MKRVSHLRDTIEFHKPGDARQGPAEISRKDKGQWYGDKVYCKIQPKLCDVELRLERFDEGPVTEVDLISKGGFCWVYWVSVCYWSQSMAA